MQVRTFILVLILSVAFTGSYAQYGGGDYEYTRETVWGITKATNSGLIGGLMIKHTRLLDDNKFHGFALEIVNIKHPQEQKIYTSSNNTFILGKEKYLYSIRMSYDREYVFFRKAPQQGVQINGVLMGGPTFGIEAPYYIEVPRDRGNGTKKVPYDADVHNGRFTEIIGTGNILQGIGDSRIVPGINLKGSLAFEFGTFKSNVVGLELGFQADFFTRKIEIIPTADNNSIYPNAFVTLYYGGRK